MAVEARLFAGEHLIEGGHLFEGGAYLTGALIWGGSGA